MEEKIKQRIKESIEAKQRFLESSGVDGIRIAVNVIVESLKNGGKVLICGNGGSAADAQHIAAELVGKFWKLERRGYPAIALSSNTSNLTAWGNDYEFQTIFSRQVEALGKKEDVLIGLSTSGNSDNVIKAMEKAKSLGMGVISLTGHEGGKMKDLSDININVPSNDTPRIQECHSVIYHILCELVEKEMVGGENE